jgi:outer membrane protein TolC
VSRAEAEHEAVVADYRQTVLVAFQEVQDNLAAAHALAIQATHQEMALAAARRANAIAAAQYQAGTISGLDALTLQRAEQTAEIQSLRLMGRRLIASVQLLKIVAGEI